MRRTENLKRNLKFSVIQYIIHLLLQFILRTILITSMGAEYLGLNGLFTNFFSFLNFADLGVGSAIIYSLYKPIADKDEKKIVYLIDFYKKYFLILSSIILVVGILGVPFLKDIINYNLTIDINIYILFFMYVLNALLGYMFAHKRVFLVALQRNDIENKIKMVCELLISCLQIVVLLISKNFYLYFACSILLTIINCIIINFVAKRNLPDKIKDLRLDSDFKKKITTNIFSISIHKFGNALVNTTDIILISIGFGVVLLGVYSNYLVVISGITAIFTLIYNSLTGSVGNLIATEKKDYVYDKFKLISFLFGMLTVFCTVCLIVLFNPFIEVWIGSEYLLDMTTVLLICINFFFSKMKLSILLFRDSLELYNKDKWKPIFEIIINLILAILFMNLWGINGIFIATIITTLLSIWVDPYILYKNYFGINVWHYFKKYILSLIIVVCDTIVCSWICSYIPGSTIGWFAIKAIVCVTLSLGLLIMVNCANKDFKEVCRYVKRALKKQDRLGL